ncbi:MAG: hypothetical protein EA360_11905 [Balneolaceae bacterium]|nr:MAG: hypothetical protein EA360_11905 [Balneolaceae bacterium]
MNITIFRFAFLAALIFSVSACSTDSEPPEEVIPPAAQELRYFWFFGIDIENDIELERLDAAFPAQSSAYIEFKSALSGYPATERMASMERRNRPTAMNYRPAGNLNLIYAEVQELMRAIQVKEPFTGDNGENELILHLPLNGFERPLLTLAVMDEGAARAIRFDYSISSGSPQWITSGLQPDQITQTLVTGDYIPVELDLSAITGVNNNPDVKVRIRFTPTESGRNEGDRVTLNNISLDAAPTR